MSNISKIIKIVEDPFNGPFEGEDFNITDDGFIEVPEYNHRLAGMICRKVNTSNKFDQKLVKFGQKGDAIILGFDDLENVKPEYTVRIGYKNDVLAEIKIDNKGLYRIYISGRRQNKLFNKLSVAKAHLTRLDKGLKQSAEVSSYDYDYED